MKLDHKNIMRFIEVNKDKKYIYLFVEHCNGGDLKKLIKARGGKLSEQFTQKIAFQISKGLYHLYLKGVIHRDLKPDNILIHFPNFKQEDCELDQYLKDFKYKTEPMEAIIGDFGFARFLKKHELATS